MTAALKLAKAPELMKSLKAASVCHSGSLLDEYCNAVEFKVLLTQENDFSRLRGYVLSVLAAQETLSQSQSAGLLESLDTNGHLLQSTLDALGVVLDLREDDFDDGHFGCFGGV